MGKLLPSRIIIGIFLALALILLSILANLTGWSGGADKILTVALGLVCAIPIGNSSQKQAR
jgi:hypothetical protein